jgi:hypothetical protein
VTTVQEQHDSPVRTLTRPALAVGLLGAALLALGWFLDSSRFFQAYLMAYTFWLGFGVGSLAVAFIQFLTGGAWGIAVRRVAEAGAATLWLLALLFVPLLLGLPELYPWARPAEVNLDPLLQYKSAYLNVPFFVIRAAAYLLCWCVLSVLLNRWSRDQDETGEPHARRRLQRLSIVGAMALGLTVSFAAIDWLMSLEPHWYSTVYGAMVSVGMVLTAYAFMVLVVIWHGSRSPLEPLVTPSLLNDLGSLLLTFLMLWAYMAYFQYLLIWSGNLTEEIPWFVRRLEGSWQIVALIAAVGGFAVPFSLLLFRGLKRDPRWLAVIAGLLLCMRLVTNLWLVMPVFQPTGFAIHWLDPVAVIALGGLWLAVFSQSLTSRPLLPLNDERMQWPAERVHG